MNSNELFEKSLKSSVFVVIFPFPSTQSLELTDSIDFTALVTSSQLKKRSASKGKKSFFAILSRFYDLKKRVNHRNEINRGDFVIGNY